MKNWDITVCQIVLLALGGYYFWQSITNFFSRTTGSQQAFVLTMTIGVILLGLALALHEVRRFRAKKSVAIKIEPQA